jgi:hypothetical protein
MRFELRFGLLAGAPIRCAECFERFSNKAGETFCLKK